LFSDFSVQEFIEGVALLLGAYPLYQSTKKLIPLYKFPVNEAL
jgi:hypothetical protein